MTNKIKDFLKMIKSTHLPFMQHLSSPTPCLHPASSSILTFSFSLLIYKIIKFMETKLLELLLEQESGRN